MITKARSVAIHKLDGRELWLYPKLCMVGYRLYIAAGETRVAYQVEEDDFISGSLKKGGVCALPSATIIAPGGEVLIRNDQIDKARRWPGSLKPIANGVHIRGNVSLTGIKDSVMYCVSPRNNLKGFHDKRMERVHLNQGQSITFAEGIVGFVVVYGEGLEEDFPGYFAEAGDTYIAKEDTVMAVVYRKDTDNESE